MLRKKYSRKPRARRGRRVYRRRIGKSKAAYHAPKKFVTEVKLLDVIASPYATHMDGYTRNQLDISLTDIPLYPNLATMYGQMAITSVKLMYRPSVTSTISQSTTGTFTASQLLFAENKDYDGAESPSQVRSEDNCRTLVSTRSWSHFVKKPRPALYQQDFAGNQIKVIGKAKDIHWLSVNNADGFASTLSHLIGQLCVEDVTGTTSDIKQGELWAKVYISCKEQRKTLAV